MPMEKELNVSVSTGLMIAGLCWLVAVGLLSWGTIADHMATLAWGLAFVGVAATAQLRHYFCRQNRLFRNAFTLTQQAPHLSTIRPPKSRVQD